MKVLVAVCCLFAASVVRCDAQVINGEGTYEDGAAHVPPRDDPPPPAPRRDDAKQKKATEAARPPADRD